MIKESIALSEFIRSRAHIASLLIPPPVSFVKAIKESIALSDLICPRAFAALPLTYTSESFVKAINLVSNSSLNKSFLARVINFSLVASDNSLLLLFSSREISTLTTFLLVSGEIEFVSIRISEASKIFLFRYFSISSSFLFRIASTKIVVSEIAEYKYLTLFHHGSFKL